MDHKAFIIYKSHCDIIKKKLNTAQKGRLFEMIMEYTDSGTVLESEIPVEMIFEFMKINIDIDRGKYERRCSANQENGKKGGRRSEDIPLEPKEPTGLSGNPENPDAPKEEEKKKKRKVKVKEVEEEIENRVLSPLELKLGEFIKAREEQKKPIGPIGQKALMKKLLAYSEKTAIEMIDNSIINGWQGVFEIKGGKGNKKEEEYQKAGARENWNF